MVIEAIF